MTVKDMDMAVMELTDNVNHIMALHQMSPSIMMYVMNTVMVKLAELRLIEYSEMGTQESEKEEKSTPRKNSVKLSDIEKIMKRKAENGEVGEDGRIHVNLSDMMEEKQSDSESTD